MRIELLALTLHHFSLRSSHIRAFYFIVFTERGANTPITSFQVCILQLKKIYTRNHLLVRRMVKRANMFSLYICLIGLSVGPVCFLRARVQGAIGLRTCLFVLYYNILSIIPCHSQTPLPGSSQLSSGYPNEPAKYDGLRVLGIVRSFSLESSAKSPTEAMAICPHFSMSKHVSICPKYTQYLSAIPWHFLSLAWGPGWMERGD